MNLMQLSYVGRAWLPPAAALTLCPLRRLGAPCHPALLLVRQPVRLWLTLLQVDTTLALRHGGAAAQPALTVSRPPGHVMASMT